MVWNPLACCVLCTLSCVHYILCTLFTGKKHLYSKSIETFFSVNQNVEYKPLICIGLRARGSRHQMNPAEEVAECSRICQKSSERCRVLPDAAGIFCQMLLPAVSKEAVLVASAPYFLLGFLMETIPASPVNAISTQYNLSQYMSECNPNLMLGWHS